MKIRQYLTAFGILFLSIAIFKFTYLFASTIWRADLYYYMEFARTMLDGGVLYKDFGCSHPPFGYLEFYWIAKIFGYDNFYFAARACGNAIHLFTAFIVYLSCEKLYGFKKGIFYSIFFVILTSSDSGFWPNNIPLTFMLPMFAAFYFIIKDQFKPSATSWLFFGFFVSCATMISTNVVFYALMVPFISIAINGRDIKKILKDSVIAFSGFMIPIIGMAIYFYLRNALSDWYFWNIIWGSIYGTYKPWYVRIGHLFLGVFKSWAILPVFAISIYAFVKAVRNRKILKPEHFAFIAAAFITAILSKLIMNKPVSRYNLYMIPGLFFVVLFVFEMSKGNLKKALISVSLIVLMISTLLVNINAWRHPHHIGFFADRAELREAIMNTVPADKTIFVWDTGYEIYYETKRKRSKNSFFSPSKFLDKSRLWKDQKYKGTEAMWSRFLSEFTANPPDYLIDYTYNFDSTDWEPKDGKRENIHKVCYDKFYSFVAENYKEILRTPKQGRILQRISK